MQWRVLDETVDAPTIAAAIEFATAEQVRLTAETASAKQRFTDEIDRFRTDHRIGALLQGDDTSSGKLAAKNIRLQLRETFPETRFCVRVRSHGSIDITWSDGPTTGQIRPIAAAYEGGHFDGMEDIYRHRATPWTKVFGGSEYIFTARHTSDSLLETAIAAVFAHYVGNFRGSGITATAADYRAGKLFNITIPGLDDSLELAVRARASEIAG